MAVARRDAGVRVERVARPVDDEQAIVVDLDLDTRDQAADLLRFLETAVWSSSASSPALADTPVTALLEPAT